MLRSTASDPCLQYGHTILLMRMIDAMVMRDMLIGGRIGAEDHREAKGVTCTRDQAHLLKEGAALGEGHPNAASVHTAGFCVSARVTGRRALVVLGRTILTLTTVAPMKLCVVPGLMRRARLGWVWGCAPTHISEPFDMTASAAAALPSGHRPPVAQRGGGWVAPTCRGRRGRDLPTGFSCRTRAASGLLRTPWWRQLGLMAMKGLQALLGRVTNRANVGQATTLLCTPRLDVQLRVQLKGAVLRLGARRPTSTLEAATLGLGMNAAAQFVGTVKCLGALLLRSRLPTLSADVPRRAGRGRPHGRRRRGAGSHNTSRASRRLQKREPARRPPPRGAAALATLRRNGLRLCDAASR